MDTRLGPFFRIHSLAHLLTHSRMTISLSSKKILRITETDVIDGKIDHIKVSGYDAIYIYQAPITELPEWPLVQEIELNRCILIEALPIWPMIKKVTLVNCLSIRALPNCQIGNI